jgi:hypothetical protein
MLQSERIQQLMKEVGPAGDFLAVDAYSSEGVWHVAIDELTEVFVEMAPARGVLVVTGQIGKPAGGDIKALYELFLRYAHVWDASEGLRMSLDAPDGRLWLLFDCTAHDITPVDFSQLITRFAAKLQAWREIVAMHAQAHSAELERVESLLDPLSLRG